MGKRKKPRAKSWHVYVVSCRDGSLYIGITNDLVARLAAHNAGRGGAYTRSRRPVSLAFSRRCISSTDARRLEVALKRLDRSARLRLIAGDVEIWRHARAAVRAMNARARLRQVRH